MSIHHHQCCDCGATVYVETTDDGRDDCVYSNDTSCGCALNDDVQDDDPYDDWPYDD